MKKQFPDISVIIPLLNEEQGVTRLCHELQSFAEKHSQLAMEFVLVNDGSSDQSRNEILRHNFPNGTMLINLSRNFGSHAALRAGISHATGRYYTFLYADLQDPVDNIVQLYKKILCGKKSIVWAFRNETSNGRIEKFFSAWYARLMRQYVNPKYPHQGFDVVMFDQKVARELNRNMEANSSLFLQILNMGFESDSILYKKLDRNIGKSKWTVSKKIKLLIDSFVGFSFAPIRMVSLVGIIFFVVGVCWSVYIVMRKLMFDDLANGWPALLCVLLLGFGITNISLGIIAEYLWRTLDASRKRPVYIIDEVVHL